LIAPSPFGRDKAIETTSRKDYTMRGTAEFQIIGRIGRIATVGTTLKINIASDYPRKQDDGSWDDNTHWNTVTVFNDRTIEWIKTNTKPGDLVHARGRLRNGSYEKDGEKVYTVDLITTEFLLLAKHQPADKSDSLVDDEA